MSWNEPGGGNRQRDPWGGKDQGPPDLDEALRKLQDQLNGLFGGRSGGGSSKVPEVYSVLLRSLPLLCGGSWA